MSITIHLRPETEQQLAARAAQSGVSLQEYVRQLVEREGGNGTGPGSVGSTFEEMTMPLAQAVEASGMTEEELGEFFEVVVSDVRAEKRAKKGQTR